MSKPVTLRKGMVVKLTAELRPTVCGGESLVLDIGSRLRILAVEPKGYQDTERIVLVSDLASLMEGAWEIIDFASLSANCRVVRRARGRSRK